MDLRKKDQYNHFRLFCKITTSIVICFHYLLGSIDTDCSLPSCTSCSRLSFIPNITSSHTYCIISLAAFSIICSINPSEACFTDRNRKRGSNHRREMLDKVASKPSLTTATMCSYLPREPLDRIGNNITTECLCNFEIIFKHFF